MIDEFLISSFGKIEMTKLSEILGENYSHDMFTKKLLLVETSQLNHIYLCTCGFIRLEYLRINQGLNHFAIKEKIYIQALSTAYHEVEKLKYA